jgi:hypothetical protein
MKRLILALGILTAIVCACVKTEPVSPVPKITFISFQLFDGIDSLLLNKIKIGILEFSFIDGDADIGIVTPVDTNMPNTYNYNVFLIPFKKIDGNYIKLKVDSTDKLNPPPYYRIEHDTKFDRIGQDKTIKGTIKINIEYFIIPSYDTMKYDFYILDRAMHKSNIESTTDIGFR